jgi:hypothetical protein
MKKLLFPTIILALLAASSLAHAFGMASSYLENNTMYLAPDEQRDFSIEIQNVDDTPIKAIIKVESAIAHIEDEQGYYLVGGEYGPTKDITLVVRAPENATPGQEYTVKYSAYPEQENNSSISLNVRLSRQIRVIISPLIASAESPVTGEVRRAEQNMDDYLVLLIPFVLAPLLIIILLFYSKSMAKIRKILKK